MASKPKTEKDWEAESDARTLIEYVRITKDKARMARAQKALGKLEDEARRAQMERRVARKLRAL